jgi:hypothetical protein
MGTIVVAVVLLLIVGLAVRSMVRDKKNGISLQCGGNCKNCEGHCSSMEAHKDGGKK